MSHVIEAFPAKPNPFAVPTMKQREAFFETLLSNAKLPRHAPTIMVREKVEGSRTVYYALNPKARLLAMHETGDARKPFSEKLLRLMADLGFEVEVVRGA